MPRIAFLLPLILSLSLSTACAAAGMPPAGIWIDRDYGFVIDARRRAVQLYDVVDEQCVRHLRLTPARIALLLGELVAESDTELVFENGPNRYTYRAADALPPACAALRRDRDRDPLRNFDLMWSTIATHQASLQAQSIDWAALRERQRPRAAVATSPEALFAVLSETLAPLQDAHVTLSDGEQEFEAATPSLGGVPAADAPTWKTQRWALKDFLDGADSPLLAPPQATGNRRLLVGELADDLGYLALLAMAGYDADLDAESTPAEHAAAAGAAFDALLPALRGKGGLVIDLRYNEGGYDHVGLALVARLTARPLTVFAKRTQGPDGLSAPHSTRVEPVGAGFDGPIAVLIGPYTISAAEVTALALSALPDSQLIGQPSYGAWSDAVPKALPNGWQFSVAPEVYVGVDGTLYSTRGIAPALEAPTPVLGDPPTRYTPAIEVAREWLRTCCPATAAKTM